MHDDLEKAAYCDLVRPTTSDLGMLRDNKSGTEGFSLRDIYKVMNNKRTQEAEFKSLGHFRLLILGTLCACSKSALLVYYTSCTMRAGSVHRNQIITDTMTFKVALLKRGSRTQTLVLW